MKTKGIVLAGGAGTRLYPLTDVVCKQLLPVYDKPMVYYPISTLMLSGIREILVISTPQDIDSFRRILGDGTELGVRFSFEIQDRPRGIAESLLIGEPFIAKDRVALILGDNLFYGGMAFFRDAVRKNRGATVFAYRVQNPERYGVVEFDSRGRAISIEEKPKRPKSTFAVTGLYLYNKDAASVARSLKPSGRGELEITDVNRAYLKKGRLDVVKLDRGMAWLDTGTHRNLLDASNFIQTIEVRQGLKLGCLEEVAFRMKFIGRDRLRALAGRMKDSPYRDYLKFLLDER